VLFDLQVRQQEGWVVLAVVGEVDLASAPKVRQAVIDALAAGGGPPSVVLDLGSVDFIDSSGLGVVLGALKRVRAAGGRLRVVVREPQVRRIFELTDLDRILALAPSLGEALTMEAADADRTVSHG
jgi:anti-sigma B factor antagonist